MRYFKDSMDAKLIALPSDPLSCWIHWNSNTFPGGHSITREHLKAWEVLSALTELTEEHARAHDSEMFSECLDSPYNDAESMIQFYIQRAQECIDFEPPVKQVEHYLIHDLDCREQSNVALHILRMEEQVLDLQEFGIISCDKTNSYIVLRGNTSDFLESYFQEKINNPSTHRAWWRYNTLEKNLTPEVFNDRMRRI